MNYATIIRDIAAEVQPLFGQGRVADYIPELNPKGNSVLGMKALELFTTMTGRSVF